MNAVFLKDIAERAAKTFVQAYLGFWLLTNGLLSSGVSQPDADLFDTLFTVDNVKAGVVGVALSLATSVISKPLGKDPNGASLVVTTVE